ncbi:hypothetical protein SVAN01_09796 [Stagonosporopsis vannaccii]|nr:hypothetical protein SVAN01_09796 [Stagonosporopsis vannaccii]
MRSTSGHAPVLWRIKFESSCGSSGSSFCAFILPGAPCVKIETTRLTDQTHLVKRASLNQTLCVARIDLDSGSRKPGLVDEDEADACRSLRSTFGMIFSNTCQRFKERPAIRSTGIGFLGACRGVWQHRLLSSRKIVSGVLERQILCSN